MGRMSWIQIAKRICRRSWNDEVFGQSARLAFYFFFAMFPLLLLLLIVLGRFAGQDTGWRTALLQSFNQILPHDVSDLLARMVRQLNGTALAGSGALIVGATAIWSTLNGTLSIITGLNTAYEVQEKRPWWRLVITTTLMTLCLCILALSALWAIRLAGIHPGETHRARQAIAWAITILLHALCFTLLYRFGPSLDHRRWDWSVPGGLVATVLWTIFTSALRIYQHHVGSTQQIYGSLTPIALLLMWLYLIGGAIFLGAETNAVIAKAEPLRDRQLAPATHPGAAEPAK